MATATKSQQIEDVLEAERRGLIAPNFGFWLASSRPDMPEARWDYRHMLAMQESFDGVTRGDYLRLLIQVSGRHGKTEHMKGYAGYTLDRDRRTRVLFCTYNQKQANKVSRQVQRNVKALGVTLDAGGVELWETPEGGYFQPAGVGTGVASVNADLILIDDPIGTRAEAESQAHRDMVWDWLTTDILARAEPHTRVVFSMPRWHADDPAGRMQIRQADRWHLVDMPGRALEDDQLGRSPDELLWPELRNEEWHAAMRADLLEYGYASFIQCRPRPREGGLFKDKWWKELGAVPAHGQMVRYWDTAGTTPRGGDHDPDYTAGALVCAMESDQRAIVDVARFRLSVNERDNRIVETAKADMAQYAGRIRWWFETESGIAGKERTDQIIRRVQALGMPCYADPRPTKSKVDRYEPLASKAEAGNVFLCPGDWSAAFRDEMADMPGGRHDDQADAVAGADAKLARTNTVTFGTYRV